MGVEEKGRCRLGFKDLGRRQCATSRTGGLVASHTTLSSFVIVRSCIYIQCVHACYAISRARTCSCAETHVLAHHQDPFSSHLDFP